MIFRGWPVRLLSGQQRILRNPSRKVAPPAPQCPLRFADISARQGQSPPIPAILNLVIAHAAMFESRRGSGEIEGPHAIEARIEHRLDPFAVGFAIGIPCAQRSGVMQPQHLDVAGNEAIFLARRDGFRKRRDVAAWKDVFARESVGCARCADPTSRTPWPLR